MTNPSCFHSFPNDNHVDDAGTQTTEWMNMSQFLTFHKAISNEWTCQLLQEEDGMGRECDVVHFHFKHSKSIKTVIKAILEHNQHSLKRRKLEIISTSLSQFIWFPRFHHFICICSFILCNFQSIHSMVLQTL